MDYRLKERILKNMLIEITKKYDYILGDYRALEIQYNERLHKDFLTGLYNREGFMTELKKIHKRCEEDKVYYGVILLDLDNFKYINSSYGNDVGDLFIKNVADILISNLTSNSILGRIGGDEFAIAVYDIDERDLIKLSDEIKKTIEGFKFIVGDSFVTTTASVGISLNEDCNGFMQVFEQAANAMAESKQRGKNAITFYDEALQIKSQKLIEGRNLILKALSQKNSVIAHIQPIVDTNSLNVVGGEFLMRLSLNGKLYTPISFLESAIYFDLIDNLESEMLEFLLKFSFRHELFFFLNKTIKKDEKIDKIFKREDYLKRFTKEKNVNLVIEITENSLFDNMESVKKIVENSRDLGIRLAIDDFGSGYTSLRYIHDTDVDFLKVDGGLIKEMKEQPKVRSIVEGIVYISKKLGIKTIAEFVESEEDYINCVEVGMDYCQGYYFYKPMCIEEFFKLA